MKSALSVALCLLVCLNIPQVTAVSTTCIVCEYMVVFAEEAIQVEGWNQTAVLDRLHGYCFRLPSIVGTVCEGFLETYGDQLITELWNDTPADGICSGLGICQFDDADSKNPVVGSPEISDYQCELCEYTVGAVELFLLAEKYNETEILNELEGLCDIVPQELELECRAFVLLTAPKIVDAMLANTPPEQVCASFSLCSSVKLPTNNRNHSISKPKNNHN